MKAMSEEGVENVAKRKDLLKTLNAPFVNGYRVFCCVKIWTKGFKNVTHEVQINVNNLEREN